MSIVVALPSKRPRSRATARRWASAPAVAIVLDYFTVSSEGRGRRHVPVDVAPLFPAAVFVLSFAPHPVLLSPPQPILLFLLCLPLVLLRLPLFFVLLPSAVPLLSLDLSLRLHLLLFFAVECFALDVICPRSESES